AVIVAHERQRETLVPPLVASADGRQRRQLVTKRDVEAAVVAVQVTRQVAPEENLVTVETDLAAPRCQLDRRLRCDGDVHTGRDVVLEVTGSQIDFVVRTLT